MTVPGTAIPATYGGKQREVMVDLNTQALQAKGLGPSDVVDAIGNQNLILPGGTSKIGQLEYDVEIKASPARVAELNDLPIKTKNGATIYVRDVANVRDGYPPQTNVVRSDGQRGSLMTILKNGDVSTLDIISGIRKLLPRITATLPPQLKSYSHSRSVDFRARVDQRRGSRSSNRGLPHGDYDFGVSRQLAKHGDYRDFHSAVHLVLDLRA